MRIQQLAAVAIVLGTVGAAHAQTGVSDSRVSLPEGPGSLEGIGENVSVNPNMGMMGYGVNIDLPKGYEGITPSVALGYNSGGGASVVGQGWSMPMPSIERMTNRGVPLYDGTDHFAMDGGQQLVQVSDGEPAVYRARFEGGFVRYKWFERGAGDGGYWVAEYPDGAMGYFGADRNGDNAPSARLSGESGTFRYHLVEKVDVWGHRIGYTYTRPGAVPLVESIGYVFEGDTPRFGVQFIYEPRGDHVIDAKPGFQEVLAHRLAEIKVLSGGITLQRHALSYQPLDEAGGISRLAQVERFGLQGGRYPAAFGFEYSQSLGGVCDGVDCQRPFLVEMSQNLGVNFRSGNVTLVDINGDALPDLLDTSQDGPHRFFINTFRTDDHTFSAVQQSAVGTGSSHRLSAGRVQVLDVNGDGFADLLNTGTGQVLENRGEGDWVRSFRFFDSAGDLPDLEGELDDGLDPENGDLAAVRFMDVDNDKRIDVIKSVGADTLNQTTVYRNEGPSGFAVLPGVESLGLGFDSDRLQLADINGDGMLDPVRLQPGALRFRINLGRGRWAPEVQIQDLPFGEAEVDGGLVELEDLNNDGLDDLVIVRSSEISYAINSNGVAFDAPVTLRDGDLPGGVPRRDNATTVLFADMNGSGSQDIVWVTGDGGVTYLELFPLQPHLLSRITNGLGMVTDITYSTTVEHAAQAEARGEPWERTLNFASTLVTRLDIYDTLSNVHQITDYTYRDGFYDGKEKQFRGFGDVLTLKHGDDSIEDGSTRQTFDLGEEDPYRAGLALQSRLSGADAPIQTVQYTYDNCPLAEIPAPETLAFPIRFVCQTGIEVTGHERAVESEWTTVRVDRRFDGYGNIVGQDNHGITAIGGQGCEPCQRDAEIFGKPCGQQCLGDERFSETETIEPGPETTGDRWILGKLKRARVSGRRGSERVAEATYFYDGPAFEGLPEGQLIRGALTRTMHLSDVGGPTLALRRFRHDAHGNIVEAIAPGGDLEVLDNHRETMAYDPIGLNPLLSEVLLVDENGEPYKIRRGGRFEPLWNQLQDSTDWQTVRGGQVITPEHTSSLLLDEFGRTAAIFRPGDDRDKPAESVTYELGSPVSRIVVERRSELGGPLDMRTVRCVDGLGRATQERTQIEPGRWMVSGFQIFNTNNTAQRAYVRYESDTDACDVEPPSGVPYEAFEYDVMGRLLRRAWFSGQGEAVSFQRMAYGPTWSMAWDENDTDPESPHFDTPVRHDHNGLEKRWRMTRIRAGNSDLTHDFTWDELGNFRGWVDPSGNEKVQTFDLVGRLVGVDDPDRGATSMTLDAAGNILTSTDARGVSVQSAYDGASRLIAQWDEADPEATRIDFFYDFARDCDPAKCTNGAFRLVETRFPVEDGFGARHYGFNPTRQLVYEAAQLRGRIFEMGWRFDNLDQVVERTFPDGQTVAFERDGAQRITRIEGFIEGMDYNGLGLAEAMRFANGTTDLFGFDDKLRVNSRATENRTGTLLSLGMSHDLKGNLMGVVEDVVEPGRASLSASMTYDDLYRLTSAHLDAGREGFDEMMVYAHDDLHNLVSKTSTAGAASPAHVGDITYGGSKPHAALSAGGLTFDYDAAGHTIRRGELSMAWDALGRMVETRRGDEVISSNAYDTGRSRVLQTTKNGTVWSIVPNFEIRDGIAITRLSVGGIELAQSRSLALATTVLSDIGPLSGPEDALVAAPDGQIDAGDAVVAMAREEGWLDFDAAESASPSGALLSAAVARLLVEEEGDKTFFHADGQGNTIASTDGRGELIDRATYYPFGMVREGPLLAAQGYSGEEHDEATGFIYYGARHLDPWLGRWISPDPLFDVHREANIIYPSEGIGAYAFVRNNPTSLRDMGGTIALETAAFTAMIIGGFVGSIAGAVSAGKRSGDAMMLGGRASKPNLATMIFGAVTGAYAGATSFGAAAFGDSGEVIVEVSAQVYATKLGFGQQSALTIGRFTSLTVGIGLSIAATVTLGALGVSGVGLPAALTLLAVYSGVKALHIFAKHNNFYRKAGIAVLKLLPGRRVARMRSNMKASRRTAIAAGQVVGGIQTRRHRTRPRSGSVTQRPRRASASQ